MPSFDRNTVVYSNLLTEIFGPTELRDIVAKTYSYELSKISPTDVSQYSAITTIVNALPTDQEIKWRIEYLNHDTDDNISATTRFRTVGWDHSNPRGIYVSYPLSETRPAFLKLVMSLLKFRSACDYWKAIDNEGPTFAYMIYKNAIQATLKEEGRSPSLWRSYCHIQMRMPRLEQILDEDVLPRFTCPVPEPFPQNTHIRFNDEASPSPPEVLSVDETDSYSDGESFESDDEYTYNASDFKVIRFTERDTVFITFRDADAPMPREIDNSQVNYHRTIYRAYDETSQQCGYWIRRDSALADDIINSQPVQTSSGKQSGGNHSHNANTDTETDTYMYHAKDFSIVRVVGQLGSQGRSMFVTLRGSRSIPTVICKYEIEYDRDLYSTKEPTTQQRGFWINKESSLARKIVQENYTQAKNEWGLSPSSFAMARVNVNGNWFIVPNPPSVVPVRLDGASLGYHRDLFRVYDKNVHRYGYWISGESQLAKDVDAAMMLNCPLATSH
jgi:hypothetical protein